MSPKTDEMRRAAGSLATMSSKTAGEWREGVAPSLLCVAQLSAPLSFVNADGACVLLAGMPAAQASTRRPARHCVLGTTWLALETTW
eukprot:352179-Chlamydomonas_euryale.AAC.7